MEPKRSKVRLMLVDLLDRPIKDLKVEIKTADKRWYAGSTNAAGVVEFTALQGLDLIVHVEHWLYKSMKPVARLFSGLDDMAIKLVSPKVKQEVALKPLAEGGAYLRGTYKVKSGDTLSKISKAYGVSGDFLAQINHLPDKNQLSIGQILKVPPVPARTTAPQKHAPAKANPPHSAPTPQAAPTIANGTSPDVKQQTNPNGKPVTVLEGNQPSIIFPLKVRPLNEEGGTFSWNNWGKAAEANAACFGAARKKNGGGFRRHAARDLYANDLTEVFAIAPGKVLRVSAFYCQTDAIVVHHKTIDGREFVIRYGEVDPATVQVKAGDEIPQGQMLGKTGVLKDGKGEKLEVTRGKNVSMLHFEAFSGVHGLDRFDNLSGADGDYSRRADLIDSLNLLREGYLNTFKSGAPAISQDPLLNRRSIDDLSLSEKGEAFIKDYEKLRLDYYDDSEGYCTVGWGHLVNGKKSCASQGIVVGSKISEDEARAAFKKDKQRHEVIVKNSITSDLYQHEYDALCALSFNLGDLSRKAPALCRKINSKDYVGGASEFLDITNGGVSGLVKRRKQENSMFLNANYDSSH